MTILKTMLNTTNYGFNINIFVLTIPEAKTKKIKIKMQISYCIKVTKGFVVKRDSHLSSRGTFSLCCSSAWKGKNIFVI